MILIRLTGIPISLVSGTGDDDNSSFSIVQDSLVSAEIFVYETKSSYSIRVRTTDTGSLYFEKEWTILVNDVTGLSLAGHNIRIYPVPVTDQLILEFPYQSNEEYTLVIMDLKGQKVLTVENIRSGQVQLSGDELPPGFYILELRGTEIFRSRIVKTR